MEEQIIKILQKHSGHFADEHDEFIFLNSDNFEKVVKEISEYIRRELIGIERQVLNFHSNSETEQKQ